MTTETQKEIRFIEDRLAYLGRYLESISPKVSIYKEMDDEKEILRKKLKELKKQIRDEQ